MLNPGGEAWTCFAGVYVEIVQAKRVVLATGAMERPVPFKGWTLPGVMGAGAAQIALKVSGLVADRPVVLAGSGPLLLLVAKQILAAGGEIRALLEMVEGIGLFKRSIPRLPLALAKPGYLRKGMAYYKSMARYVPLIRGVVDIESQWAKADRAGELSNRRRQGLNRDGWAFGPFRCDTCDPHHQIAQYRPQFRSGPTSVCA